MLLRLGQWWFSFLLCFEIVKVIIVTITTTGIEHVSCLEIEDQSRVGQWKTLIMQLPRIYQIVGSESALQLRFIEIANTAKQLQKCFSTSDEMRCFRLKNWSAKPFFVFHLFGKFRITVFPNSILQVLSNFGFLQNRHGRNYWFPFLAGQLDLDSSGCYWEQH